MSTPARRGPVVIDTDALAQREHDADRWIAATAIRLSIPLESHDRAFESAPGLALESAHP